MLGSYDWRICYFDCIHHSMNRWIMFFRCNEAISVGGLIFIYHWPCLGNVASIHALSLTFDSQNKQNDIHWPFFISGCLLADKFNLFKIYVWSLRHIRICFFFFCVQAKRLTGMRGDNHFWVIYLKSTNP